MNSVALKSQLDNEKFVEIQLDKIKGFNANRTYAESEVVPLMESIRDNGLVQPVVVFDLEDGTYDLVAGHRRLHAFKKLLRQTIPAVIKPKPSAESYDRVRYILNVTENIHRSQQDSMEQGRQFQEMKEKFDMSDAEVAACVNKSKQHVIDCIKNFEGVGSIMAKANIKTVSGKGASRGKGLPNSIATLVRRLKQGHHLGDDQTLALLNFAKEGVQEATIRKAAQLMGAGHASKEACSKAKSAGKVFNFSVFLTPDEAEILKSQSKNTKKYVGTVVKKYLQNLREKGDA